MLSSNELQDQNRSKVPVQTVTNTTIGYLINKCLSTNQPFTVPQYTTLNERYKILAEESLGKKNSRDFELKYFTIGVRGSNCDGKDANGVSKYKVNQHKPTDANLFTPIPFVARPIDSGLNNINREQFRMRTVEERDGQQYEFWWICLIDFTNYNPSEKIITRDPVTGNESAKPYIHKKDDLENPQPEDFTSEGTTPVSNTYLNSSAILDCSLNGTLLAEISNACKIYFGDASYGSINEVGTAYGIDTKMRGAVGGGGFMEYTEVASCIIAHYVTEKDGRNTLANTRIQQAFDHGASVPMLLHSDSTATALSQGS